MKYRLHRTLPRKRPSYSVARFTHSSIVEGSYQLATVNTNIDTGCTNLALGEVPFLASNILETEH